MLAGSRLLSPNHPRPEGSRSSRGRTRGRTTDVAGRPIVRYSASPASPCKPSSAVSCRRRISPSTRSTVSSRSVLNSSASSTHRLARFRSGSSCTHTSEVAPQRASASWMRRATGETGSSSVLVCLDSADGVVSVGGTARSFTAMPPSVTFGISIGWMPNRMDSGSHRFCCCRRCRERTHRGAYRRLRSCRGHRGEVRGSFQA